MNGNLLITLLILTLASPPNATAGSWMSLRMSATAAMAPTTLDDPRPAPAHEDQAMGHHAGHGSHAIHDSPKTPAQVQDDSACDDHCMNCIAHCHSAAIFALPGDAPLLPAVTSTDITGELQSRKYLLFRPPKFTPGISGWFAGA